MLKTLLALVAFISLAATANEQNLKQIIPIKETSFNIHALNTANYYDQFLFTVLGDCNDIDSVWFHSTHAWEVAEIGKSIEGKPLQALLSIQLFENGTYWAEYEERTLDRVEGNGTYFDVLFTKEGLEGSWKVDGTRIDLAGLGTGTPYKLTENDGSKYDAIRFTLTKKINDPRAVNSVMTIGKSGTNTGPKGVSINKYCGVN